MRPKVDTKNKNTSDDLSKENEMWSVLHSPTWCPSPSIVRAKAIIKMLNGWKVSAPYCLSSHGHTILLVGNSMSSMVSMKTVGSTMPKEIVPTEVA